MAIAHELAGSFQHPNFHFLEAGLLLGVVVIGVFLIKKLMKWQ